MDFFAAGKAAAQSTVDNTDDFAKAIQDRFGVQSTPLLTTLNPPVPPSASKFTSLLSPDSFKPLNPDDLEHIDALIIDIRPHAAYASARIPGALSLSVPSTLLKRPLFSLDRLAAMLPNPAARNRFQKWKQAKNIVVYDADSSGTPSLPEGSNILGLLRKFANDESGDGKRYSGGLYWLKGGFQRVWREKRSYVDLRPPEDEVNEDDENGKISSTSNKSPPTIPTTLRPNSLPMSAFASISTTKKPPQSQLSSAAPTARHFEAPTMAANPFFDVIRQNVELSHGITERIPLRLPKRVRRRIDDLPFQWLKDIGRRAGKRDDSSSTSFSSSSEAEDDQLFSKPRDRRRSNSSASEPEKDKDNEIDIVPEDKLLPAATTALLSSSSSLSPSHNTPPISDKDKSNSNSSLGTTSAGTPSGSGSGSGTGSSSESIPDPDPKLVDLGMENLAMQFYRIELAEQRRLMGIMQHHSKESEMENKKAADSGGDTEQDGTIIEDVDMEDSDNVNSDKGREVMGGSDPERRSGGFSLLAASHQRKRTLSTPASAAQGQGEQQQGQDQEAPSSPFPYSITAGVEKGAKNRYRHIWPFEHARVRLHQRRSPGDPNAFETSGDDPSASDSMQEVPLYQPRPVAPSQATLPPSLPSSMSSLSTAGTTSASTSTSTSPVRSHIPHLPLSSRFLGGAPPSGALTGPMHIFTPSSSAATSRANTTSPSKSGPGFTLTLPAFRTRTTSAGGGEGPTPTLSRSQTITRHNAPGALPPVPPGPHPIQKPKMTFPPSMVSIHGFGGGIGPSSLPSGSFYGSSGSLPSSFTSYRNPGGGSGDSAVESTTESEWEGDKTQMLRKAGKKSPPRKTGSGSGSGSGGESATGGGGGKGKRSDDYDDYVNASYVQPLCSERRYIATQGPLEATFVDFWTLVYQQNVHVIVMLTREIEGSMVKCAPYWLEEEYGPLRLKLVSVEGKQEAKDDFRSKKNSGGGGGFFFPSMPDPEEEKNRDKKAKEKKEKKAKEKTKEKGRAKGKEKEKELADDIMVDALLKEEPGVVPPKRVKLKDITSKRRNTGRKGGSSSKNSFFSYAISDLPIIKRVFELSHTSYPDMPPRRIVHFQYLDWPDMNVPDDPRGLLGLIKEVDKAVTESNVVERSPHDSEAEEDAKDMPQIPAARVDRPRKHARTPSNESIDRRTGIAKRALGRENAPVLLHCSAGVGRTGGFIAVDSVLDGIRRELRKARKVESDAVRVLERARLALGGAGSGVRFAPSMVEDDDEDDEDDDDAMEVDDSSPGEMKKSDGDDIDMADGTIEMVQIPGHDGDTYHVAVHRTMVSPVGPNPHLDRRGSNKDDIRTPMQVDPVLFETGDDKKLTKKKQKEAADTTTRMWSQNVSDQTGNYGSASRVNQVKVAKAEEPSSDSAGGASPSSGSVVAAPQPIDPTNISELSSASEDSFGFLSGFDKRFTPVKGPTHRPSNSLPYQIQKGMESSATSLSTGSGNGNGHREKVQVPSSLLRELKDERQRTWSAPSGRPAAVSEALADPAARQPFIIASGSRVEPKNTSPGSTDQQRGSGSSGSGPTSSTSWLLPGEDRRSGTSPIPLSDSGNVTAPPPSRSLSPGGPTEQSGGSSDSNGAGPAGLMLAARSSGSGSSELGGVLPAGPVLKVRSSSPSMDNNGSGSSGPGSSVPASGSGTGSGIGSGSGSGFGSSGSGSGAGSVSASSRSRSVSVAEGSPMEGGVLPTAGEDTQGLRGFDKKLDKVAAIAATKASEKVAEKANKLKSTEAQRAAFDYTEPRPLHQHDSPKALSEYKEPMWEVVQDMREQRMSLCQSLRQYVFVHAAVIEGALMIIDEENERDGRNKKRSRKHKTKKVKISSAEPMASIEDTAMATLPPSPPRAAPPPKQMQPPLGTMAAPPVRIRRTATDNSSVTSASTSGNKRQASPTELPQEDKKGGQLLHKKPSIKRKPDSDEKLPVFGEATRTGHQTLHPTATTK